MAARSLRLMLMRRRPTVRRLRPGQPSRKSTPSTIVSTVPTTAPGSLRQTAASSSSLAPMMRRLPAGLTNGRSDLSSPRSPTWRSVLLNGNPLDRAAGDGLQPDVGPAGLERPPSRDHGLGEGAGHFGRIL